MAHLLGQAPVAERDAACFFLLILRQKCHSLRRKVAGEQATLVRRRSA
jgi:hypothetical protein